MLLVVPLSGEGSLERFASSSNSTPHSLPQHEPNRCFQRARSYRSTVNSQSNTTPFLDTPTKRFGRLGRRCWLGLLPARVRRPARAVRELEAVDLRQLQRWQLVPALGRDLRTRMTRARRRRRRVEPPWTRQENNKNSRLERLGRCSSVDMMLQRVVLQSNKRVARRLMGVQEVKHKPDFFGFGTQHCSLIKCTPFNVYESAPSVLLHENSTCAGTAQS